MLIVAVYNLHTLIPPGCYNLVKCLHGSHNLQQAHYNLLTRLSHGCTEIVACKQGCQNLVEPCSFCMAVVLLELNLPLSCPVATPRLPTS